jgi:hypothetical protein
MGDQMRVGIVEQWSHIVASLNLDLTKPINTVTAGQVKAITKQIGDKKEPRLMASMTTSSKLPTIFKKNGVFVLPISNGVYAIVKGKGYQEIEEIKTPTVDFRVRMPFNLDLLSFSNGEGRYLLHAYNSGLLNHFCGQQEIRPTAVGKMRTANFDFYVDGSPKLEVRGAQMEIDMGFDSKDQILIFEGKAAAEQSDFLIRQLYYPYRSFNSLRGKAVRAFFFWADSKSNAYHIWEYGWKNSSDYESIFLIQSKKYVLVEAPPLTEHLHEIEPDLSLIPITTKVVPQANDIQKVADFPLLLKEGIDTAKKWANHYRFDPRQGNYYRQAAEALGLVTKSQGRFKLTLLGEKYVLLQSQQRSEMLAELLLRIPLFNDIYNAVLEGKKGGIGIKEITRFSFNYGISGSTSGRRASTMLAYFKWISDTTGAVVVRNGNIYSRDNIIKGANSPTITRRDKITYYSQDGSEIERASAKSLRKQN